MTSLMQYLSKEIMESKEADSQKQSVDSDCQGLGGRETGRWAQPPVTR